jgi:hypothetical protein
MDETTITINLELRVVDDCLTGSAVATTGECREFLGRLGLLATIDALVDDSQAKTFADGDDDRRGS